MRTKVYDEILASMSNGDERAIYAMLVNHIGKSNRITKEELARSVYGKYNPTTDRKVRVAISRMRFNGKLICSDSGSAGYYLPETEAEVNEMIAELSSRCQDMFEQVRQLQRTAYEQFRIDAQPQMRMGI